VEVERIAVEEYACSLLRVDLEPKRMFPQIGVLVAVSVMLLLCFCLLLFLLFWCCRCCFPGVVRGSSFCC